MQFIRQGQRVQLGFASGEHFAEPMVEWLRNERIGYATLTGLGAVRRATVSYWNADTKQYETHQLDEQMEVVSLIGNVTLRDNEPFVHAHIGLGRSDLSVVGGHLNDLEIHPTLEIWLLPGDTPVRRTLDESCGLYLMQLPEQG